MIEKADSIQSIPEDRLELLNKYLSALFGYYVPRINKQYRLSITEAQVETVLKNISFLLSSELILLDVHELIRTGSEAKFNALANRLFKIISNAFGCVQDIESMSPSVAIQQLTLRAQIQLMAAEIIRLISVSFNS
jgi:hypothetical protein